ncbi:MAG: type II toxin-antitoxin system VapC family toxin [Spirochaetales bacterium]|nr:type II toxin-antitoxin system VapC family toxin [Spirochaetales bacterium]
MKILLDTHYLIWVLTEPEKINKKIKDILKSANNEIFISSINFWEISLKSSIGKMTLNNMSVDELYHASEQSNLEVIQLTPEEAVSFHKLPLTKHKDPFDRMLIWQAIINNFSLLTEDRLIKKNYLDYGLKIVE